MDDTNQQLKTLLAKTDKAFRTLMKEPDSAELNKEYETAKVNLNAHIAQMRASLQKRTASR